MKAISIVWLGSYVTIATFIAPKPPQTNVAMTEELLTVCIGCNVTIATQIVCKPPQNNVAPTDLLPTVCLGRSVTIVTSIVSKSPQNTVHRFTSLLPNSDHIDPPYAEC